MDYKEKYEMALEGIQEILSSGEDSIKMSRLQLRLQGIFPELKESEDENIRKAIHIYLDWLDGKKDYAPRGEYTINDMIDWIEKQGKHQKFRDSIQVGDKVTRNEDGVLVNLSQLNRVAKKQGEQKHVDKAEQKFKVGDWVVYCNEDVDLITGIEENGYCINNGGYIPFICASDVRLWTIQDAKTGDVLATDGGVCIFDGTLEEGKYPFAYCGVTKRGFEFYNGNLPFSHDNNIHPATKEQRDTLERAMADAGYIFDFEKKELRKLKFRVGDEVKTENEESLTITRIDKEGYWSNDLFICGFDEECIWNLVEQNRAWSEEDEKIVNLILCICSDFERSFECSPSSTKVIKEDVDKIDNWLKSLRPQKQWKPSDEQMDALRYVTNFDYGGHKAILVSLYEQLKKLNKE